MTSVFYRHLLLFKGFSIRQSKILTVHNLKIKTTTIEKNKITKRRTITPAITPVVISRACEMVGC